MHQNSSVIRSISRYFWVGASGDTVGYSSEGLMGPRFLALKVMCLSFEKKLNFEWVKIARVTKELGAKRAGKCLSGGGQRLGQTQGRGGLRSRV